MALVDAAVREMEEESGDVADWNEKGYYFVTDGRGESPTQTEYAKATVKILKEEGIGLETEELESVSAEEASRMHPFGTILWGGGD